MKRLLLFTLLLTPALLPAQTITPDAKSRAAELVKRMTLEEKIDYIGGYNDFYIRAVPRLGIPEIRMADGPQGVRNDTRSTMYASGIAAAATWSPKPSTTWVSGSDATPGRAGSTSCSAPA